MAKCFPGGISRGRGVATFGLCGEKLRLMELCPSRVQEKGKNGLSEISQTHVTKEEDIHVKILCNFANMDSER